MLEIGRYTVSSLVPECFALDGGAMFGAVPKTLWERLIPADEKNRIPMACRVLVLSNERTCVIIETGCGTKFNEKFQDIYAIENKLPGKLHQALPSVTDVILTHLHFDHAGGVSYLDASGKLQLSFPNARHFVSNKHWEHAKVAPRRERASFLEENLKPLESSKLCFTNDGDEILPEITVHEIEGHTHGQNWIKVGAGRDVLAFPADLIPTSHHIDIPYVMGYDLSAETAMKEKESFLEQAEQNQWLVVFAHDREIPAGKIGIDPSGRYFLKERIDIPEIVFSDSAS